MTQQDTAGWERHLQSILLGILVVVVIGFGSTTIHSAQDIAVIKTEVVNIQLQMQDKMGDRYTGTDARAYREFDALRADNMQLMIDQNRERLRDLEQRFDGND